MRYKVFFLLTVSMFLEACLHTAIACGPFSPIIPTPEFFKLKNPKASGDYEREENLRLWQSITSVYIPLSDIEQVVYKDSRNTFLDYTGYNPKPSSNRMYIYLKNSDDSEVCDFLGIAKEIEEKRRKKQSPWHYPKDRNYSSDFADFQSDIERCKEYDGNRLRDRYALQIVRALFASRQYESCIEYSDSAFSAYPDSNLMKRMAQRYVAGCWRRLGDDTNRADSIFAKSGDIWSIPGSYCVSYMMEHNPDAPQVMEYIRSNCSGAESLAKIVPMALAALKRKDVVNKGDWAYLLAYYNNEYAKDVKRARIYIKKAMKSRFSSDELHDLAKAYKMKIDANVGNSTTLLADLKWIEGKCDVLNFDAVEWVRRTRNILYVNWIPRLWNKKDYATAILLASYADSLVPMRKGQDTWKYLRRHAYWNPACSMSAGAMRESEECTSQIDYGSLSFQMMGSLSSSELATAYMRMLGDKPLFSFLRKGSCMDRDYYYELIGTLALREENYSRAIRYLSKVSDKYQHTMNIYKDGYLNRNPFIPYPTRWNKIDFGGDTWENEGLAANHGRESFPEAKLNFARKMLEYQHQMRNGRTKDERGWAKLMYAIGRRNSFEECWALTQYWRGSCTALFVPYLDYWEDGFGKNNYAFLYNYEYTVGHGNTELLYHKEIASAMAMLQSDEMRAKAEYLFGNLKTVIKKYPDTKISTFVKASCDNWKSWF